MSDESEVRRIEEAERISTLKLSEAIRLGGYTQPMDYDNCVLGCAYRHLTGRRLTDDGFAYWKRCQRENYPFHYTACAADAFGVPRDIALEAEQMCYGNKHRAEEIADWLESQGY